MRNSPWAKLTISMRPKMRERPAAMRAYTKPIRSPLTRPCRMTSALTSMLSEQGAVAGEAIGDATGPEGMPEGRRVDGDDGLAEPALRLVGQPHHGEIGAGLDDGVDMGTIE